MAEIPSSKRASNIEYAIRDVVVPATELESQGHSIIKLNIGDPIAYPGLPTPSHMVDAFSKALIISSTEYPLPVPKLTANTCGLFSNACNALTCPLAKSTTFI